MKKKNKSAFLLTSLPYHCNFLNIKTKHLVGSAYQIAYHILTIKSAYHTFFCCIYLKYKYMKFIFIW